MSTVQKTPVILHGMDVGRISKFLFPVLLTVLVLTMADDGVHDPNLYQFLDFTRVEQNQKNEHRPFRWLNRFRRKSQAPAKFHWEATTKEQHGSRVPINYVVDDVSTQYRPYPAYHQALQRHRESAKKPKDNSYIILPPPPPASQAKQINIPPHDIYIKQEKKPKIPFMAAHRKRKQANKAIQPPPSPPSPLSSPDYKQQVGEVDYNTQKPLLKPQVTSEVSYSSQPTVDNESDLNAPFVLNGEGDSGEDSPPTHVGSRYSKWFGKLRRNKAHHNQPEDLRNQSLKLHDKPSEDLSVQVEPLYYFQNPSPNNPSQPIPHQPINGNGYRQPQTVNNTRQLAPPRAVSSRPQTGEQAYNSHSPALFRLEAPVSPTVSHDSQENSPDSSETEDQSPASKRKKFISKFVKKIKRTKNKKQEEIHSQEEPIFTPLQTAYKPPIEPTVYRPPQTTTNYPPQPVLSRPPNVKPHPVSPAAYSSFGTDRPVLSPPVSVHHEAPAPTTYSPPHSQNNKYSPIPSYSTTEQPVAYSPPKGDIFSPPKEPDFVPSILHGQSEKVHGSHESFEDGFFEFGIFPKNNGFFEQNFNG